MITMGGIQYAFDLAVDTNKEDYYSNFVEVRPCASGNCDKTRCPENGADCETVKKEKEEFKSITDKMKRTKSIDLMMTERVAEGVCIYCMMFGLGCEFADVKYCKTRNEVKRNFINHYTK